MAIVFKYFLSNRSFNGYFPLKFFPPLQVINSRALVKQGRYNALLLFGTASALLQETCCLPYSATFCFADLNATSQTNHIAFWL